jgi:hypothetical protein
MVWRAPLSVSAAKNWKLALGFVPKIPENIHPDIDRAVAV